LQSGKQFILCKTPRFSTIGPCTVEVSMNGSSFTSSSLTYNYYSDTTITRISPSFCSTSSGVALSIDGTNLVGNALLKVRFKSKVGKAERIVPGKISTSVVGTEVDPETEEEVDVLRSCVTCKAPRMDLDPLSLPWETRVAVAINGKDFKTLEKKSFVFHDFRPERVVPSSAPMRGGTVVRVLGTSFFDQPSGGGLRGRFLVERAVREQEGLENENENEDENDQNDQGGEEEASASASASASPQPQDSVQNSIQDSFQTITIDFPVVFVDKNTLEITVPPLPPSLSSSSADFIKCALELSFNGGETYVGGSKKGGETLEFTYYDTSVGFGMSGGEEERVGPRTGGARLEVRRGEAKRSESGFFFF